MSRFLKKSAFVLFTAVLVVSLTGCSAEAKRKRHLSRADAYYTKGEYQRAEIEYLNAARLGAPDLKLYTRLGTIYHAQGRVTEAYPVLAKAKELNPDDLEVRYRLGSVFLSVRQISEARKEALFILSKRPADPQGALLLADTAVTADDVSAVRRRLAEVIQGGADNWAVRVALAQLLLRENKLNEAEAEVQAALKMNAAAPEVSFVQAEIAGLRKQNEAAEAFLRTAMENAPPRSPYKLHLAKFKMQTQDREGAKKLLDQVLKQTPDYTPASALRGQIALTDKDFPEAERIAQSVLSWNPRSYEIRLMQARAMMLQQQATNALQAFIHLENLYPNNPEVKYEMAIAHLQTGSVDEALKKLDEALRIAPSYGQAIFLRAELKLRTGAPAETVTALLPYTRMYPEDVRAQLTLANAYRVQKQPGAALAIYRELAQKQPTVPEFTALTGFVHAEQGRPNEARTSFEQALKISPLYIGAAEELVDLDLSKKDFVAAERRAAEQVKLHTNSGPALMLLAKVAMAKGDNKAAVAALTQVTQKIPEAGLPYLLLAQINFTAGDRDKALAEFKSAAEKNPRDAGIQLQLGMAYDSVKDYPNARKHYETAVKLNPKMATAWNNLAYLLMERFNELENAAAAAAKARELAPNDPDTADTLGWIYFLKGEYPQALTLLRESSLRLSKNGEAIYHLARTEYAMGLDEAAAASFKKVLTLNPATNLMQEASHYLAVLGTSAAGGQKSIDFLEATTKKDARDYVATLRLAEAYQVSGNQDKALAAFERAAKLNPFAPQPLIAQAGIYGGKLNNLPKAFELAKSARKLAPNDPSIAGLLGRLSYRSGDFAGAVAAIQENARSATPDPELVYELGLASYGLGQFVNARTTLADFVSKRSASPRAGEAREAITLIDFQGGKSDPQAAQKIASARLGREPNDMSALMTSGLLLEKAGDFKNAALRYEQVLALNKAFAPALRQLTILYADQLSNDDKALELGTKARESYRTDGVLAKALGKAAYRKADYRQSTTLLIDATVQNPSDAEAFLYLGLSQNKLNKPTEAKIALNKTLSMAPGTPFATQAKLALQQIK